LGVCQDPEKDWVDVLDEFGFEAGLLVGGLLARPLARLGMHVHNWATTKAIPAIRAMLARLRLLGGRALRWVSGATAPERIAGKTYLTSHARVVRYQAKVQQLLKAGYSREGLAELQGRVEMMSRGYLKLGHGKYNASGHGIDAIYRHADTGEIAILESKYRTTWRAAWKINRLLGQGYGHEQMSDDWIRAVIDKMATSQSPHARNMAGILQQESFQHKFASVLNSTGGSFVYAL